MKAILVARVPVRRLRSPDETAFDDSSHITSIGYLLAAVSRRSDRLYCSKNIEIKAEATAKIMRYCRLEARSFFRAMAAECDLPQWHIESNNGRRDFPRGVMAYTTRGGVSAYTVRSTIPVLWRARSCWESVRWVIPVIERFSTENRFVPWKSCSRTAAFQRPPTMRAVVSTGQSSGRLIMLGLVPHCIPRIVMCVTYPHVTMLAHSSSILTKTISGLDL